MHQVKVLAMAALLALLVNIAPSVTLAAPPGPPQPEGFYHTVTAYKLDVAYWSGIEPHYGAFFSGSYGYNQHYLGPGGDPATCGSSSGCIGNWNWWGDWLNVLLVPKGGWLWTELPGGSKWQGSNYQATLWVD